MWGDTLTEDRPAVALPDGSVGTVRSIGVGDENGEWVIPTIVSGKAVSNDEAISLWKKGENKAIGGPFKTVEEANQFAQTFHESEAKRISPESWGDKPTASDTNKWGDSAASTPRPQGIALEGAVGVHETPITPPVPEGLSFWQAMTTPAFRIFPEPTEIRPGKALEFDLQSRGIEPPKPTKTEAITLGAKKALSDIGNFFTSPLGILTLGTGALPVAAQRTVALGFAAQMGAQTPKLARELGNELGKPEAERDYAKISELVTSGAANTAFVGLGVKHGAAGLIAEKLGAFPATVQERATIVALDRMSQLDAPKTPLEQTAEQIKPVAPLTAAALKEVSNASNISTPAEVHGDVRPLEEPAKELPIEESSGGVQPQTEGGIREQPPTETPQEVTPEMVGMGGATRGEVGPSAGEDIHGIAERVRKEREAAGQTAPTQPGEGISAPESVEHGRTLLAAGEDAESVMREFEKTRAVSSDAMALSRAHGESLANRARKVEEQFGTDSDEYRNAFKELSDWDSRMKDMQTEWHRTGMAQQGEVDIDTGTFTGLQRAYKADTGEDFTPGQANKAKKVAAKSAKADAEAQTAKDELFDHLKSETPSEEGRSKEVWSKVKEYLDKGETDYDDIRSKVATDLGMKVDDVTRELSRTKKAKALSDEMWRKQYEARKIRSAAKTWLKRTSMPAYHRALANVPNILFSLKVGFHGTVALGTHAPMVAFQPKFWATYVRDFAKMYRMVGKPTPKGQRSGIAYYEQQVQDLIRRPNYITARRAGLVNDPYTAEDFNNPEVSTAMGKLTAMGNRGYTVLKILRQDMFDQMWDQLPDSVKGKSADERADMAKALADSINHATGVVKANAPRVANLVLFAPRLLMSRGAWLVGDPLKAADTFIRWKEATPAEKMFATNQAKEKAWVVGTALSMLALNQGFLSATGSKQQVNFTNPFKSDWMKFKVAGMTASYGNAMLSMARLPLRLWVGIKNEGKLNKIVFEDENTAKILWDYARSQGSPFASMVMDLAFGRDFEERPLPRAGFGALPGKTSMPKRLKAQGAQPYSWWEYGIGRILPIPFEEAFKEVWKEGFGMDSEHVKKYMKALGTIAAMGATGGRVTEDPDAQ